MDYLKATRILEEYAEREKLLPPAVQREIDFDKDLFNQQREFINNPSKRKGLVCGRRSGKSTAAGYYLTETAYEIPKAECTFLGLTLSSAKKVILPVLFDIIKRYKLPAEYMYSENAFNFSNGSVIRIIGADQDKVKERLRGLSYDLSIVDEAQAFGEGLVPLIEQILAPAARERNGTICLIGTPDIICSGLFYEVTTGKKPNWKYWSWDLTDNRYYAKWRNEKNWKALAQQELDLICKEEGLNKNSDTFVREYLGKWVEGGTALVYKFNSTLNTFQEKPKLPELYHIFGVDFGVTDASALLVAAYSPYSKILWILSEYKEADLSPEAVSNLIKKRYDEFLPVSVVCDGNGIGAAFIKQIQAMYELPIELAEKKDKVAFIELLNDDLLNGKIKIHHSCKELIKEITHLQWADPILKELPEHGEDHLLDALLYLWRKSQHFMGEEPKPIIEPTASDYSKFMREQELDRVRQEQDRQWWDD